MRAAALLAASLAAATPLAARAEEPVRLQMTIKDHRFTPADVTVPANRPIVITVQNDDPTAEEFDSTDLGVEKVIAGGRSLPVRIRPLAPGKYSFIGEYHSDTAKGTVTVEAPK